METIGVLPPPPNQTSRQGGEFPVCCNLSFLPHHKVCFVFSTGVLALSSGGQPRSRAIARVVSEMSESSPTNNSWGGSPHPPPGVSSNNPCQSVQGTCVQIAFLKLAYELVGFRKGLSHGLGLAPPSSAHDQRFLKL